MGPMPLSPEEQSLLDQLRAGDPGATQKVFFTYVTRLMHLARERLSQRMARRVDPEDIVQSVFRTFFGRLKEGHFTLETEDDLGKILVSITIRKVLRQVAFHRAAKRDPGREEDAGARSPADVLEICSEEPSPDATLAFLDQLEHLLNRLSPRDRKVLEMRLQGYSNAEIAEQLGTSDRHVRRVLMHIRALVDADEMTP